MRREALVPLDELQGKMRRNNCQWQQPTMTRAARQPRSGQRERVFMITGIGVHDRTDWPFTITGMRTAANTARERS
jgi:hypothetical protein